jgi:hypothetical protein
MRDTISEIAKNILSNFMKDIHPEIELPRNASINDYVNVLGYEAMDGKLIEDLNRQLFLDENRIWEDIFLLPRQIEICLALFDKRIFPTPEQLRVIHNSCCFFVWVPQQLEVRDHSFTIWQNLILRKRYRDTVTPLLLKNNIIPTQADLSFSDEEPSRNIWLYTFRKRQRIRIVPNLKPRQEGPKLEIMDLLITHEVYPAGDDLSIRDHYGRTPWFYLLLYRLDYYRFDFRDNENEAPDIKYRETQERLIFKILDRNIFPSSENLSVDSHDRICENFRSKYFPSFSSFHHRNPYWLFILFTKFPIRPKLIRELNKLDAIPYEYAIEFIRKNTGFWKAACESNSKGLPPCPGFTRLSSQLNRVMHLKNLGFDIHIAEPQSLIILSRKDADEFLGFLVYASELKNIFRSRDLITLIGKYILPVHHSKRIREFIKKNQHAAIIYFIVNTLSNYNDSILKIYKDRANSLFNAILLNLKDSNNESVISLILHQWKLLNLKGEQFPYAKRTEKKSHEYPVLLNLPGEYTTLISSAACILWRSRSILTGRVKPNLNRVDDQSISCLLSAGIARAN